MSSSYLSQHGWLLPGLLKNGLVARRPPATGQCERSTLAFDGILDPAHRVLHLAFGLVQLALALKARIAGQVARAFLAAQIGRGACQATLVDRDLPRAI